MQIEIRPKHAADLPDDLPAFLRDALAARGVRTAADLDLTLADLHPPTNLPGIDAAAERLARAVVDGDGILIAGDFDADGATASALCVSVLRAFGVPADRVGFLVPNRFEFGYGLTPAFVEVALKGKPDVIVTVDNGTASIDGVALAQSQGVDVVVTDHHLPGDTLPEACAVVNPNLDGSTFASPNLAGVGVAYYVLGAVRSKLRRAGHFERSGIAEPRLADWLDLVAIGTVADVVPLDRNNRILVHQGLRRIRAGKTRPGVAALIQASRRAGARLTASDLGFAIAPRLNAAGRLRDMAIGIRCLLAGDAAEARRHAWALSELNDERREIEAAMNEDARLAVETGDAGDGVAICVYEPGWHQGVVGIVAGRLRERYHKPAIAFADAGPGAPLVLKGSARSISGLHIRDVLADCAARHPGLIDGFGGHAMAAGLSIRRAALPRFRAAFDDAVAQRVTPRDLAGIVVVDGELGGGDLILDNARLIAAHGPWGKDFEEPRFHGEFEVVAQRVVGERHLKLVLKRDDRIADAIAFNREPITAKRVRAVYRLAVNDYGETDTLQLGIEDLAPLRPSKEHERHTAR